MLKKYLIATISLLIATTAHAGSVSLTSHYPAPYGRYDQLRLVPRDPLPANCDIGTIYVDKTSNLFQYCSDDGVGTGIWGSGSNYWTRSGLNIYTTDSSLSVYIGIGTATPSEKLHIQALNTDTVLTLDNQSNVKSTLIEFVQALTQGSLLTNYTRLGVFFDAINLESEFSLWHSEIIPFLFGINNTERMRLTADSRLGIGTSTPEFKLSIDGIEAFLIAKGTQGSGTILTDLGAGTRMIWYPKKSAFRAGEVTGAQWNGSNMGNFSVGTGLDSTASGDYSLAMGSGTTASNDSAIAMGISSTASGIAATAFGKGTTASGDASTASGSETLASGHYSTAVGYLTQALGQASLAAGYSTQAVGDNSMAAGYGGSQSLGNASTAFGKNTKAVGDYSFTAGESTSAEAFTSVALGWANYISGTESPDTWVPADPLFVIGDGTVDRSNSLTVLKNGNVGIDVDAPTYTLHIAEAMRLEPISFNDAPACTENGIIYVDTTGALCFCDGTSWIAAAGGMMGMGCKGMMGH